MTTFRRTLGAVLATSLVAAACAPAGATPAPAQSTAAASASAAATSAADPADTSGGTVTDYASADSWMLAPVSPSKDVDVFYIYPTAFNRADASAPVVAAATDEGMREGAQAAYARQASAFARDANVYAPYYRQLDAVWALGLSPAQHREAIAGAPTKDVTAAFEYYLDHWNQGRPFVIAGHSQGSDVATHLIAGYLRAHPDVQKRMVVAYVIGYSVTQDWLDANPQVTFATGATDTGVIVSYNTEATSVEGTNPVVLPGALAINPITWTREGSTATPAQSLGSWMPDASGAWVRTEHFADATVDAAKGVVIAAVPDVTHWSPGGPNAWPKGVYHTFDYPFYYFDLQANLVARTAAYLAAHPGE